MKTDSRKTKNYAALVRYFALRKKNISVTKMSSKLIPVVAATLPRKKTKLPNCNHSKELNKMVYKS